MTFNQKKFLSLSLGIAIVCLASILSHFDKPEAEKVAEQQAAANKATKELMRQGGDKKTVRKPGESGFKSF